MNFDPSQWTSEDAKTFAQNIAAEAKAPPDKRHLFRPLPPAPAFPVDALGPLQDAAVAIQQATQAPMAIAAQSVLAAATLAVQAQRDVVLPGGGQRPLTAFFVSVAESGERKSSVDRLALEAVYRVEEEWRQQAESERPRYVNDKTAWDNARDHAKKASKGNVATLRSALDAIGPEPKAPPNPMLLIADPTPEALIMHLADGRPMAGVFTAEGGILVGGAAFKDESRMRTAALFNTLWDGDPIRRRRVGTGASFLPGRRCSAHVMLQPVVATSLFGDAMFDGIGLTARMLLVAPESTAGTRLFREIHLSNALPVYNHKVRFLLTRPPATRPGMPDALAPPAMSLNAEATRAWIAFHDLCERALPEGRGLATIRAFGAKLPEHAGRLAAVLAVYHEPDAMEVPEWAMRFGIELATHYGQEMLRLHGGAAVSSELRSAERLLSWWQAQPHSTLSLAMIYQLGPAGLRDAATARKAVQILADHDWVEQLEPGTHIEGKARKEVWKLRP